MVQLEHTNTEILTLFYFSSFFLTIIEDVRTYDVARDLGVEKVKVFDMQPGWLLTGTHINVLSIVQTKLVI